MLADRRKIVALPLAVCQVLALVFFSLQVAIGAYLRKNQNASAAAPTSGIHIGTPPNEAPCIPLFTGMQCMRPAKLIASVPAGQGWR